MIYSLGHAALSVKNMERSLKFYRDLLGMRVIMDLDVSDNRMAKVTAMPEAKCRIVHLKLGNMVLELFEYSKPTGKDIASVMRQCDRGFTHIGFEVTDFHKHVAELKSENVEFLGEPVEFRPGVWVIYFRGPNGEVCELREQPNGNGDESNLKKGISTRQEKTKST